MKNASKEAKLYLVIIFFIAAALYMGDVITNSLVLLSIPAVYILGYTIGNKK